MPCGQAINKKRWHYTVQVTERPHYGNKNVNFCNNRKTSHEKKTVQSNLYGKYCHSERSLYKNLVAELSALLSANNNNSLLNSQIRSPLDREVKYFIKYEENNKLQIYFYCRRGKRITQQLFLEELKHRITYTHHKVVRHFNNSIEQWMS